MKSKKRLIDAMALVTKISKTVTPMLEDEASPLDIYNAILECIAEAPSELELLRCQDCTHWKSIDGKTRKNDKFCEIGFYMINKNGFCSYAERNRNEQT